MRSFSRRRLLVAAGSLVLASCGAAAAPSESPASQRPESPMAANPRLDVWPDFVAKQPLAVREAYAYAARGAPSLRYIPCYCGCGANGHEDNLDCYVQRFAENGWVVLDAHAASCGVCVGITRDVIAMERQGQSVKEIRRAIDARWSKAGPSTPTRVP